jgi:hypothetical protein
MGNRQVISGEEHCGQYRNVPEKLILSPAIDLLAPSIEYSNAVGAALFPGVQHRLSSGLHPLRSNGVVLYRARISSAPSPM